MVSLQVGIGAYLVRLGQRTIQNEQSHIILTGHTAINKLLGRDVYASSLQLGGPQIMYANGVSHLTSANDFESVRSVLSWMSYLPAKRDAALPRFRWTIDTRNTVHRPDPVDRYSSCIMRAASATSPRSAPGRPFPYHTNTHTHTRTPPRLAVVFAAVQAGDVHARWQRAGPAVPYLWTRARL